MDLDKILKQAQAMQRELEKANSELNAGEFEGVASNGLVKVLLNGEHKVLSVDIEKDILNPDDKEMIEELLVIAFNDACEKIKKTQEEKIGKVTGGLKLPGM